jgi:hypothetical protein
MKTSAVVSNLPLLIIIILVQLYLPKFLTPTFIAGMIGLMLTQTAMLTFNQSGLMTRVFLNYTFILLIVFIIASMATQFVCGKDLYKVVRSFSK